MNGAEQNPAMAVLLEDNTAIESAINDLDVKIAAWVDAMDKASAALAQVARAESVAPKAVYEKAAAAPVEDAAPVESAASQDVKTEAPAAKAETPAEAGSGIVTLPGGKKSQKPTGLKAKLLGLGGGAKDDDDVISPEPVAEAPKSEVVPEKSKQELEEEDEALLAQLDPKVAQSIRIKRRLSRGKKSVRELINEMHK
ncbi:MAG: hypothetical protein KDA54_09785 [Phycisphaerales bacterium]|nr:hypothetical protein [Phycisphaerales bacterium]